MRFGDSDLRWVTWEQAVTASVLSTGVVYTLRRLPKNRVSNFVAPAARELAFISGIYAIWRLARKLPFKQEEDALRYARAIARWEEWLHMPSELSLQHFVIEHDNLAWFTAFYYRTFHVPALLVYLIWVFFRHREHYARWRTALSILTAFCLVVRFIRVAPPRFLPELGFVDLSVRYGMSFYGSVGTGVSDQYAAMPSIHIAWAAVVSLGVFAATNSLWRWPILLHLPITFLVVAATGHHWWFDGLAAMLFLGVGLLADTVGRRYWPQSQTRLGAFASHIGGVDNNGHSARSVGSPGDSVAGDSVAGDSVAEDATASVQTG